MITLLLVACGDGAGHAEEVGDPAPMDICEKDDPKNVEIRCTTVDGLRSCRTVTRCR